MQLAGSNIMCQRVTIIIIGSIIAAWAVFQMGVIIYDFHYDTYYFTQIIGKLLFICFSIFSIVGSAKLYLGCVMTGYIMGFILGGLSVAGGIYQLVNWNDFYYPGLELLIVLVQAALFITAAVMGLQMVKVLRMVRLGMGINSPYYAMNNQPMQPYNGYQNQNPNQQLPTQYGIPASSRPTNPPFNYQPSP